MKDDGLADESKRKINEIYPALKVFRYNFFVFTARIESFRFHT